VEPCAGAPLLEALPAGALLPAGLPPDVPLLGVPPLEPDAPPWLCWEGNGDSWPPPPWLELCPLPWPWPVLGLPPDEDGEFDGEPDDGDEGEDEGVDGLGIWGMDDDWVELVIEQPASASAQAAGQTRPSMVRLRIATISRAHRQSGRRKAPAPFMV